MPDRFIVTVLGKQGAGKTHLLRHTILPAVPRPAFVLDTMGEFEAGAQFESAGELGAYLAQGKSDPSGIYVLNAQRAGDGEQLFAMLAKVGRGVPREVAQAGGAACTLVVDEASKFCTPRSIDDGMNDLLQYGRHWKHNLVFAARRAAELNRNITAQSDCLISFRQTEPRDLRSLRRAYAAAEHLPQLEPNDGSGGEYAALGRWGHLPFAGELHPAELT